MKRKLFSLRIPDNRNFGLDLLRFIAILVVLILHSIAVLPPEASIVRRFIFDGVIVFFVLSGFLIGRILIRDFQEDISINKLFYFWKRRWYRTLPAYYFTILIILILVHLRGYYLNVMGVLKSLFFIQNIFYDSDIFFPESWSLSIEEWFYLTIPFLLLILNKLFKIPIKTNIIVVFIIVLLFSLLIRTYLYFNIVIDSGLAWDRNIRSAVVPRLDSILMGVLGAWLYIFKNNFFKMNKNILFIIGFIIFLSSKFYTEYINPNYDTYYTSVIYFSLIPFSVMLMLPRLYYLNKSKYRLFNNFITRGSLISYSLYLVNLTIVACLILQPLSINVWVKFMLFWILTVLLSILMYKYIETPFMKLRDKEFFLPFRKNHYKLIHLKKKF